MRRTVLGYKIGPLLAESMLIAEELLNHRLISFKDEIYFIDVPDANSDATKLVIKHYGIPVFECGRMYFGIRPSLPMNKIYGITSLELG